MGLSSRTAAVGATWRRALRARYEERVARSLRAAERNAEAAAARYQALRTAASEATACVEGPPPRRPLSTWQQLLLLVVGGGLLLGLLVMWLLATAYVGPAALLVLPTSAGLVAAYIVLRRRHPPAPRPLRRPVVADLVRAAQEMHAAEAALQRARERPDAANDPPAPGLPPIVAPQRMEDRVPWPRSRRGAQKL
jgi:hypothetical protein